ncbi:hypothetical protein FA048_04775 [Pedobacter polaris]|uniref:Uncharacterized protein n=1 Tax=Pedobacter polaris TaxID=2571273 RepID=A0A4U1CX36_9SPHI|nr:hypothetical protein [Pedobacter polaris]TKC12935.1 hypothetical protein FA048_04775 [Pedobacter polaris]
MMKKRIYKITVFTILLLGLFISSTFAHNPPTNGKQDCGIIMGNVFYSQYYSPPQGTPAVNGSCSWVKQSNNSCGSYNYNGTNYTLYPYKYICNVPLDDYTYVALFVIGIFGFFKLRKFNLLVKPNS